MRIGECHLTLRSGLLAVGRVRSDEEYYMGIESMECWEAAVAVQVDSAALADPHMEGLHIDCQGGIDLVGTGIRLGVGNGMMSIKGLHVEHATKEATRLLSIPFEVDSVSYEQVLPPRL